MGDYAFGADVNSGNDKADHVYIAEGPETALSIQSAMPGAHVIAALSVSNIAKIKLFENVKNITICMDNDGDDAPSLKSIEKAMKGFVAKGIEVDIVKPEREGMDFNDMLKQEGLSEVKEALVQRKTYEVLHQGLRREATQDITMN